jgi:predicted RNA-binding Zn-ribbon protein involved in translation (DUF1610 family)
MFSVVICPACGTKLRAPDASAGKRLKCPKCSEIVAVPGASVQTHPTPVAKAEESAPRPAVRPTSPQSQSALTCPTCRTQIRPDPGATSAYCPKCWELVALPSTPTVQPVARPKKRKPLPSWLLPVVCPTAILGLALAFLGMGGCPARRQAADSPTEQPAAYVPPALPPADRKQFSLGEVAIYKDVGIGIDPSVAPALVHNKFQHLGKTDCPRSTAANCFQVAIRVTNRSKTRKIDYRTWADRFLNTATVKDEFGNYYRGVSLPWNKEFVGRTEDEAILPGKFVDDVLVFEQPLEQAKTLVLTLPLSNVGLKDEIAFTIPISAIRPQMVRAFKAKVAQFIGEARAGAKLLTLAPSLDQAPAKSEQIADLYACLPEVPPEIDRTGEVAGKLKNINSSFVLAAFFGGASLGLERNHRLDDMKKCFEGCKGCAADINKLADEIESKVGR